VLENFHVFAAFRCMHKDQNNILRSMTPENQRLARVKIMRLVMATRCALGRLLSLSVS
jgi:hypothetical protein